MPSPKRIVIATQGSLGDLYPYMALASGLQAQGHDVAIATNSGHRKRVSEAGIEWKLMRPELPDDTELYAKAMHPVTGVEFIYRHIFIPAVKESYDDLLVAAGNADLLISTPLALSAPLLAEKHNLLWASGLVQPMSLFSAYDPPVLSEAQALTRALHPLGRVLGVPLRSLRRIATKPWGKPIYDLRRALNLPLPGLDPFWEGQDSPYLILGMFPAVLAAPQPDWPAQTRVTGALFWEGNQGEQKMTPELGHFLENGSPPIVFTLGSTAANDAGNFYSESLKAAQSLNSRAIFLYGSPENRAQLPDQLPSEAFAIPYAAYSQIFPAAAAIVHHGGVGTISLIMRAGKPMLIVPFCHDQPDNAARAARLGIARTLSPRSYNAASAAKALRALLDSKVVKSNVETICTRVKAENGVATACDLLELLMARRHCSTT